MTGKPAVVITAARVDTADGVPAATVELVDVGGGEQVVTVDGVPEVRVHPASAVYHVRLLAPTRMIPDELREESTFESAVKVAEDYAARLTKHAGAVASLADDLRV